MDHLEVGGRLLWVRNVTERVLIITAVSKKRHMLQPNFASKTTYYLKNTWLRPSISNREHTQMKRHHYQRKKKDVTQRALQAAWQSIPMLACNASSMRSSCRITQHTTKRLTLLLAVDLVGSWEYFKKSKRFPPFNTPASVPWFTQLLLDVLYVPSWRTRWKSMHSRHELNSRRLLCSLFVTIFRARRREYWKATSLT